MRYYIGGQSEPGAPLGVTVNVHRSRAKGHAEPAEIARFGQLFDHFERALLLEQRLALARRHQPGSATCWSSARPAWWC